MDNRTVIIEGNIGSGKTTLCKLLELLDTTRSEVIYEPVNKWIDLVDKQDNNILKLFYSDQERYAYTFQTYAFLTRAKLLKEKQIEILLHLELQGRFA